MPSENRHLRSSPRFIGIALLVSGGLAAVCLFVGAFSAPLHEGVYEYCARLTPASISLDDVYGHRPQGIFSIVPPGMGCAFETSTGTTVTVLPSQENTWPLLVAVLVVTAGVALIWKSKRKSAIHSNDVARV